MMAFKYITPTYNTIINYTQKDHDAFLDELISLRDPKISKQISVNLTKNPQLQQWLYQ